jgi:hypothetical protein
MPKTDIVLVAAGTSWVSTNRWLSAGLPDRRRVGVAVCVIAPDQASGPAPPHHPPWVVNRAGMLAAPSTLLRL